jgi:putative CocE/NonD family hydrolase
MRDGVRIAVDVHLPDAPDRFPTIVRQTRYFRAMRARPWIAPLLREHTLDPMNGRMRDFFVRRGYAWVDVDVRGSGASFGTWACPWSPDEVRDGAEIVTWITEQPWSNGSVGATGNSYDGTSADFLATTGHPALKAIAPRCALYDVYTDVAYPGGLRQSWFTHAWTRANAALDANRPQGMIAEAIGQAHPSVCEGARRRMLETVLGAFVRGVEGVGGEDVAAALAGHAANLDVDGISRAVAFRDDVADSPLGPQSIGVFSPSTYASDARATDVAVLGISGWFDAAYPHAAIKRHLTLGRPGHKLLLGPWNHGCSQNASPHAPARRAAFHLDGELLRFFDRHLLGRDTGIDDEPAVRFFTMGAERWRSSMEWPPRAAAALRMHLRRGGRLEQGAAGVDEGATTLVVDRGARSGKRSRWRTLVSPFVVPDYRDARPRALAFESAPLESDLEVTGHVVATLALRSDAPDGAVFVYLEEVTAGDR